MDRYETFTVLITKISRNIRKIKNQEMKEYNLKSIHVSCLYYLYKANGLTAARLCDKCEEDKATISRAVDYLEQNKYITCESKTTKRYNSQLFLTSKGQKVGKEIVQKIDYVLNEVGDVLSNEERESLYRSLSIINTSLENVTKQNISICEGD